MATALATPLSDNGHQVRLVGTHLDRDIIDSIKQTGIHPNLGLRVPAGTTAYQLEEAQEAFADAELVIRPEARDAILRARTALEGNVAPQLALEAMLLGVSLAARS